MARKALNLSNGFNYDGTGTGTAVESNAQKVDDNFANLDKVVVVLPLVANGVTRAYVAKPTGRTLSGVRRRRQTALASALGAITLAVQDGDDNTLLAAATVDAKAFTASFVAESLTATTANLALAAGEPIQLILTSDNADATGDFAIVELSFAAS